MKTGMPTNAFDYSPNLIATTKRNPTNVNKDLFIN